jgi:dTDP-4-dehydrorhamnose reductase
MLGIDLWQELRGDYEVVGADIVHGPRLRQGFGGQARSTVHRFYKIDITSREDTIGVIGKIKPDVVVHTAAYTDVDGCERDPKKAYKVNSAGTRNVALACRKTAALLIYISTDFVFNGKKKSPYKENDKPAPLSVYGDSKLKGEEAVKNILKNYFILRTSWLYGKYGKNFVDTIIAKGREGNTLRIVDDQVGCPTYTKDLAKAIHVLLDKLFTPNALRSTQYGIYHISNSGAVSWFAYAKEILRLANIKTKVFPISSKELNRPAERPTMSVLDNSKFIEFTGYKIRDWRRALKNYVR